MSTVRLDDNDLDEEDRKILAEIGKKGYYHGRPRSETTTAPQRIEAGATPSSSGSRTEFDAYQRKWDKFDNDSFVKSLEPKAAKKSKPLTGASAPGAGVPPQTATASASQAAPAGNGAGPWAAGFKS
mmetsp:Transcript_6122/g.14516  ORF Transcript_6122/g.14516 Transcript_6122/m.14516 type:complete len:127 (-) Transcript_6122:100-480(-)